MKLREILLLFLLILIPTCLANSLPYWIENNSGNLTIWTKVNISAKGTTYLFIEKEPGYSPNGDAVFLLFDDFNGDSINSSKWKITVGNPTVANSTLIATSHIQIVSKKVFTGNLIFAAKFRRNGDNNWDTSIGIVAYDSSSNSINGQIRFGFGIHDYGDNFYFEFVKFLHQKIGPADDKFHWYTYKFYWNGTETIGVYIKDGKSYIATSTTNYPAKEYKFWIDSGSCVVDYVFVRKYADKDPVVTVQQISTNRWEVIIKNPNDYPLENFQVAIPGDDIVSSKKESLFIETIPQVQINYYRSIGGYTLTISGDLGNVTVYLGSALIYSGNITENNPYQKVFPYDISSYTLKIVYHNYNNVSIPYKINSISKGTYTLSLTPVGNYTNESFYPLIITVSGKSYWISNYSCIPLNVSITAYKNTPISITTSLGEEISVPAEDQKVPIFFTTTYSQVEAKTLQGHIIEFKSKYGIVGYGQDINIKVPTGLVITPYLDNFPLQPITVSQNLNLFYSPSLIQREIYAYQTISGKIVVSIKSLLPANFTVLIKGENDTIYLNQSVIPGIYKFNYPNTNQSVILEVLVNNKVALSKTLVPPGEINSWDNLGDLTKIAILFILFAILAIVYLSSGLSAALGLTLAGSLILLLPIPERLKPILAATVFLSIMLYLYLRRW